MAQLYILLLAWRDDAVSQPQRSSNIVKRRKWQVADVFAGRNRSAHLRGWWHIGVTKEVFLLDWFIGSGLFRGRKPLLGTRAEAHPRDTSTQPTCGSPAFINPPLLPTIRGDAPSIVTPLPRTLLPFRFASLSLVERSLVVAGAEKLKH